MKDDLFIIGCATSYYNLPWTLILTTPTHLNCLPSIELHVTDITNTIIIIGVNENNVEESDAESSSMDNDKYRIHMDGDNIYVIYASPSQSSIPVKIADSSISKIDTSPINQFDGYVYQQIHKMIWIF